MLSYLVSYLVGSILCWCFHLTYLRTYGWLYSKIICKILKSLHEVLETFLYSYFMLLLWIHQGLVVPLICIFFLVPTYLLCNPLLIKWLATFLKWSFGPTIVACKNLEKYLSCYLGCDIDACFYSLFWWCRLLLHLSMNLKNSWVHWSTIHCHFSLDLMFWSFAFNALSFWIWSMQLVNYACLTLFSMFFYSIIIASTSSLLTCFSNLFFLWTLFM